MSIFQNELSMQDHITIKSQTDTKASHNNEISMDPEMEKIRRKMIRLLGVSLGIMIIGLMGLLIAVVYKIHLDTEPEIAIEKRDSAINVDLTRYMKITLPPKFIAEDFDLDGTRGAIQGVGADGTTQVLIVDLVNGNILSTIVLATK